MGLLIQELSSSEEPENRRASPSTPLTDDPTQVADQALEAIVGHYNQAVHSIPEGLPYFYDSSSQQDAGSEVTAPPVVQLWVDRLVAISTQGSGGGAEALVHFLLGYQQRIRSIFLEQPHKEDSNGIVVLIHFELLLSRWMPSLRDHLENIELSSTRISALEKLLSILASDITIASAADIIPCSKYIRSNILLATLLRLQYHILRLLEWANAFHQRDDHTAFTRTVVSLLALNPGHISPPMVVESLRRREQWSDYCIYPPNVPLSRGSDDDTDVSKSILDLVTLEKYDWESTATVDGSMWNDEEQGTVNHVIGSIWDIFGRLLAAGETGQPKVAIVDGDMHITMSSHSPVTRKMVSSIGASNMSKAIRSHFFGHDMILWEPQQIARTSTMMGRRIEHREPVRKGKAYELIPSRVHAAVSFISHLSSTDLEKAMLEQLLPICFELIEASNVGHVCLGVASLLRLLEITSDEDAMMWKGFEENTFRILDLAFSVAKEGHIIILIGKATTKLLELKTGGRGGTECRKISQVWLQKLKNATLRPQSVKIFRELLMGGLVPLFHEHCKGSNADALELGRVGLSALLSIVGGEFFDESTVASALIALVNLMVSAYPIMPRHAEKIMTTLLCLVASELKDDEKEEPSAFAELAVHTSAVALVICGRENALKVLDQVLNRDDYQKQVKNAARKIKLRARSCLSGEF